MRVYHMTEQPYPDAWDKSHESLRVNLPNQYCDPEIAADLYHRFIDEWMLCDELGIHLFINEHHSTSTCLTACCSLTMAILARVTKNVRILGLGSPIANRKDPLRVAEEMAMIDVISRGRLDMGFVKGVPYEIVPSNSKPVRMTERFWEAHDLIIKALSTRTGPFSWEGEHFHYRSVNVWPQPYQQPHPPVWISSNSVPSIRAIAERGATLGTVMMGYRVKALFGEYRKVWEEKNGPGPVPLDRFCNCSFVAVGDTEAEGLRRGDEVMSYIRTNAIVSEQFRNPPGYIAPAVQARMLATTGKIGFSDHALFDRNGERICAFTEAQPQDAIAGGLLFAGNPDQVYQQIVDFYEAVGGFGHLQMMAQAGTMNNKDTTDSLRLFAKEVMPRLDDYAASSRMAAE
jgi:alkanesulfonate monooxygenase SsuD/methylene tetrahydromethanopterin reductase-like flavin-dependent oxidoreductase (luciferase family)